MNHTVPTTHEWCKATAQIDNAPIQSRALRQHPAAVTQEITYGPDDKHDQRIDGPAPTIANIAVPRKKVPQPLEAANHPAAHLRLETVLCLAGVSRSEWYRLIAKGEAPRPRRYGSRCSRWIASEVSKFLADRAEQGAQQ